MAANKFDVIVIGAGHAGCEAALAASRMGCRVLLVTMNMDSIALMPCNPAIGGPAKAHLVREIDALGGEMAKNINATLIQIRMLNTNKGAAVHSLRAQADKTAYQLRMKHVLENQQNLWVKQAIVEKIELGGDGVKGVVTNLGTFIAASNIIITTGTYMASQIIIGEKSWSGGPNAQAGPKSISASLKDMGLKLTRFKTGTPPRVNGRSLDFSKMTRQSGDPDLSFSFWTKPRNSNLVNCWLTYTTGDTHKIINDNLHRAPLFSGTIQGVGPRYCPSIEDKIVRFFDKERHQLFVEPEGMETNEYYVQGMSTSLPEDVQQDFLQTIPGMERVEITRPGYAIEYDVLMPTQLKLSMETKTVAGLFFAGQINGTSGYEEAAAQGLMAGINAARRKQGKEAIVLSRSQGYIGVLIDDLTVKGTDEPYRMLTSRAEFRLLLRQDNADQRLTPLGRSLGLISDEDYLTFQKRMGKAEEVQRQLQAIRLSANTQVGNQVLSKPATLAEVLRRPEVSLSDLEYWLSLDELDIEMRNQIETECKFQGYVDKQIREVKKMEKLEQVSLSADLDFSKVKGLSTEAVEKLAHNRPQTLGQASRISGVSPADIALLSVYLKQGSLPYEG